MRESERASERGREGGGERVRERVRERGERGRGEERENARARLGVRKCESDIGKGGGGRRGSWEQRAREGGRER